MRDRKGVESVGREDGGNLGELKEGKPWLEYIVWKNIFNKRKKRERTNKGNTHTYTRDKNKYKTK